MATYLDGIVAWHRERAASDRRDLSELAEAAAIASELDPPRPFARALSSSNLVAVVAEIKRRSPVKGALDESLDPVSTALAYESGGAACLSVLTDAPHFGGSAEDLRRARAAVALPVLRKDFTVSLRDVYDARLMGADAVLLIAAALADDEMAAYGVAACSLGMAAVVEVHDEVEAVRALAAGASVIGVNQRDLHTFTVDADRAVRVAGALPPDVVKMAESGVRTPEDASELAAAGYDAVLVGEALVLAEDRAAAVRSLAATKTVSL